MSDMFVFKTTHPDVLTAFQKAIDDHEAWRKRVKKFARSVHPEAVPVVGTTWGAMRFVGLSIVDPIPEGWRLQKSRRGVDCLVPKRSVKAGKLIAKEFEPLRNGPDVRAAIPGMPNIIFGGMSGGMGTHSPGLDPDLEDGAIYATWSIDPSEGDTGFADNGPVDFKLWERVKLSDYYALKEAKEAVSA